jgi:hypothetical protein
MTPLTHLYLFHVHIGFSIMFFFGTFLLYHWVKMQPPAFQLRFALATMGVGIVAILITVPYCIAGMALMHATMS